MLTAIYKSTKKTDTYLYIEKRDDFSKVPSALMDSFGKAEFVMLIDLNKRSSLALADINKVRNELSVKGFYLQIPPPIENLLNEQKQCQQELRNA